MLDFEKIIHDEKEGAWLRPKTTRRYLHPPRSERMFTLWAEGKLIMGENIRGVDHRSYAELDCAGIWMVHSKYARPFDFHITKNILPENGIPVHAVQNRFGGFTVTMEAFCNTARRSTCFAKVTVKNNAPYAVREKLGFLVRTGKEKQLVHGSPDEYLSYDPEVADFKYAPATFVCHGNCLRDGEVFVTYQSDVPLSFDETAGILWAELSVPAKEECVILLSLGKGAEFAFDYEKEKLAASAFWKRELARLNRLPASIGNDPEKRRLTENLTVQMLQCFCHLTDSDSLLLRQGGLQRLIWPWEAMPALEALGRMGDFSDYIEAVLSFYFEQQQQPDGEVLPLGEGWASVTSSALYSLAVYAAQKNDPAFWEKYRNRALKSVAWIQNKRQESALKEGCVAGLFPPMRGNDWPEIFQHWTVTDCYALRSLEAVAKTMARFSDPKTQELTAICKDYKDVIHGVFEGVVNQDKTSTEIRVPLTPNGKDSYFLQHFHPYLHETMPLVVLFDCLHHKEVDRLKARFERVGLCKNGLYARMPYPNGDTHVWYTSNTEYDWFRLYHRMGRRAEAEEIVEAQIKYSMTDEYYMVERYHDNDPYYVPWSPNVSAMGRLLNMMLDLSEI